nr:MAG TPA: hypothetical protein [Caudoviricetes sp.]
MPGKGSPINSFQPDRLRTQCPYDILKSKAKA